MDWDDAVALTRAYTWKHREEALDFLLLHDCGMREVVQAQLKLIVWEEDVFVQAVLRNEPERLRFVTKEH